MAAERPPRVFISHSHDSDAHAARVLRLANDLRRDGIEAILDQYITSPPEGWHRWMDRHIREADFVVMVCTETYYRRVIGKEEPGEGLGVRWEGSLIYAHLYGSGGDLSRFVPVLTNGSLSTHIPEAVRSASYYFIDAPIGYNGILRRLFNQPVAEMPPVGKRPSLPTLSAQWHGRPPGALHGVPELPPHFVPRADMLDGLREKLLAANAGAVGVTGATLKVGVQGMGGIGKSVLASSLARDERVREAFPAGVFWVPLGQTPDLLTRQSDLHRQLTGEPGSFADAQQGRVALQEVLRGRTCLVVLDDVWRMADAEAFNVIDAVARLLLTTRDAAIVRNLSAREHRVAVLDRAASVRLLAQSAGVAEASLPDEADAIAEECGDLPLALALAGGMIGGQADMWGLVLEALRSADIEQIAGEFPAYPYPHVFAAIEASVNALKEDRERYLDLAIFPEDVPVPESVLKALWGIGALKARALINRLRDRSLAALDEKNRLSLHDLQRDFVRKRADELPARHQRLLEAWRQQCRDGWASGPAEGYFFRHLPLHLAQAGQQEELRDLLLDYAWIKAKLAATDVPALLADFAQTVDPDAALVGRALMLSAHIISGDARQLPAQIVGRLRDLGRPRIDALVATAYSEGQDCWICPRTRSLTPPGALLRTFTGHEKTVTSVAVLADGRRALSGSWDRTLRLWDVETGRELRRFEGHENAVLAVAVLADGRRALSGSGDRTLRLWDVETGSELRRFEGHKETVTAVAVLPDGRHALSGSGDRTLRLWDVETGRELRRFEGHEDAVLAVAVLADGRRALSGSFDGTARLWDVETGRELRQFEGHEDAVVALLAHGRHVLSGSYDRTLRLWDLETGECLATFTDDAAINCVAVARDNLFVAGSDSGAVHFLELRGPALPA